MISQTLHKQVHDKGRTPKMPRKGRITKSEIRNPKSERSPKSETRNPSAESFRGWPGSFMIKDFGFRASDFIRISDLIMRVSFVIRPWSFVIYPGAPTRRGKVRRGPVAGSRTRTRPATEPRVKLVR